MPILLWDASGLAKKYAPEPGSDTVDALFSSASASQRVTTILGYAETYFALVRKRNHGAFDSAAYAVAISALQDEIIDDVDFGVFNVEYDAILSGTELITRHSLHASDAAILVTFLRYAQSQPPGSPTCVLVAADQRLLRAAEAEGLKTLNPELTPAADVPALLAAL